MELTLMNMYQTLKDGNVHFNVNRMISFFGSTRYITEETWGYIAILIVNTLGLGNKEETLLYYYNKMVSEVKEKNAKFKGYKRKIPHVVSSLIHIYGENTFCWLEISFSLIRSMISWFPFRNRALYNPPGPQLSWKILSELRKKYPELDTDELRDLLRKLNRDSRLDRYKLPCIAKLLSPSENCFKKCEIHIPIYQNHSFEWSDFEEGQKIVPFDRLSKLKMYENSPLLSYRGKTSSCMGLNANLFLSPPKMFESGKVQMSRYFPVKTKINYHNGKAIAMKTPPNKDFISERGKPIVVYSDTDSTFITGDYLPEQAIFENTKISYSETNKKLAGGMLNSVLGTEMNKVRPLDEEITW